MPPFLDCLLLRVGGVGGRLLLDLERERPGNGTPCRSYWVGAGGCRSGLGELASVGGLFDADWTFYLKHRLAGQVDSEGKADSSTLGCATLAYPLLRYRVIPSNYHDPYFANAHGPGEAFITTEFELSRRCLLYADREQQRCVVVTAQTSRGAAGGRRCDGHAVRQ